MEELDIHCGCLVNGWSLSWGKAEAESATGWPPVPLTNSLRQKPSVENTHSATMQHIPGGSPESHTFHFLMIPTHLSVASVLANEVVEDGSWSRQEHWSVTSGKSGTCFLARCFCWLPWAGISICALNLTRELTQLGANLTKISCEHREGLFLLLGPACSYVNFNNYKFSRQSCRDLKKHWKLLLEQQEVLILLTTE